MGRSVPMHELKIPHAFSDRIRMIFSDIEMNMSSKRKVPSMNQSSVYIPVNSLWEM